MYNKITSYIHRLFNSEDFIPLHAATFLGNEKQYLCECIDTTYVSSVGKFVDRFEDMIAQYTGAAKAVACVNGTNALHIAMKLVGVERGDEVITQALTFIATCNAISYIGAHPVFIDVDRETMGLSPNAVKVWLEQNTEMIDGQCYNKQTNRRVKCCVPMHTFGHSMKIDELIEVCGEYSIEVVEDAAESLGSFYKGRHTGTFGKVGVISFNGNKTITTGGGGILLFQDEQMAQRAKYITTQAKVPHKWEFVHDEIGYNYRMPNVNAAIGCAQMETLEQILENKRDTAKQYIDFFNTIDNINFFIEPKDCRSNYWLNAVLLENREQRDKFLEFTNSNGVMTRPVWELMCNLEMFKECQTDGLINSRWLVDRVVNIPSSVK